MRNLIVLDERRATLPPSSWVAQSVDAAEDRVFAMTSDGCVACLVANEVVWDCRLDGAADWLWCHYNIELEAIICASRSGAIVAIDAKDHDVEVIGHFDAGLCAVAWNATDDQVALVTGESLLITMSTSWDVLHEGLLDVPSLHAASLVSLAWRADGQFLVVNAAQQIQVWEQSNASWSRHATGRYEDGRPLTQLESTIAWSPNHTLIATSQILKSQLHVIFFERNGLRHGDFAVDAASVTHLQWNTLSDVLALGVVSSTGQARLQCWTRNNYHWYLKHERRLEDNLAALTWDLEAPYTLHILQQTGTHRTLTLEPHVHASASEMATVAVIDGCQLKRTHFQKAPIPPPMCASTISVPSPINVLAFANDMVVLVTSSGSWHLVRDGCVCPITHEDAVFTQAMQSLAWDGALFWGVPEGDATTLCMVSLDVTTGCVLRTSSLPAPINETFSSLSMDGRAVQLSSGARFHPAQRDVDESAHPLYAHWATLDHDLCVGSAGHKLFVNGALLHASVASFHLSHMYLLTTTLGAHPQLHFYLLDDLVDGKYTPVHTQPVERGAKLVTTVPSRADVILQMPRGNLEILAPRPLVLHLVAQCVASAAYAPALELCRKHRVDMNVLVDLDPPAFLANIDALLDALPPRLRSDRLCLFLTNLHPVNVCGAKYPLAPVQSMHESWDKVLEVCSAVRSALLARDAATYLTPLLTCEAKMQLLEPALLRLQALHATDKVLAEKGLQHLVFLVDVDILYDHALGLYDMALTRLVAGRTQRDPQEYLPQLAAFEALQTTKSEAYMKYAIDLSLQRFAKALTHLTADADADLALSLITSHHLYEDGLRLFRAKLSPTRRHILVAYGAHQVATGAFAAGGHTFLAAVPPALELAVDAFRKAHDWRLAMSIAARIEDYDLYTLAYEMADELLNAMGTARNPVAAAELYIHYCHDVDEGVATLVQAREWGLALQAAQLHKRRDLIETEVEPLVLQAAEDMETDINGRLATYKKHWVRLTTLREQIRLFRLHGIDGKNDDGNGLDDGASSAASAFSNMSMSSVGSHNSNRDIRFGSALSFETASHSATTSPFYAAMSAEPTSSSTPKKMPRRFRRTKIQEGSADEDAYVEKSLRGAMPAPEFLADLRQLLTMLIYFGHTPTAQALQTQLDAFLDHIQDHVPPAPVHGESTEAAWTRPDDATWKVVTRLV
ncbi:hypothetical protein SDRG_09054 [Saprolegnia diclina VS20]|uniref:Elongator complex protein 1 n=1 Tax=Saprolegnia diclina (strain VS20) TaxID=1156394 RepID=T0RTE3_SAPDV|nr:hypothetical protein SDRG_09054 [Saprolegnia diclina VS20]EQC33547.1 hypothetical protein SDRG_09054 [Saprolegnia diclina VS20]|eukprot:XP_008613187.1 hypothetical protein SDRG_09054 [Saprolegnia diclina VS20]